MSEEPLKTFIAKVQADTSLQEQLKVEGADVVAIAKAAGFSITTDDLAAGRQDLSDDELEYVAGGCAGSSVTAAPGRGCTACWTGCSVERNCQCGAASRG